MNYSLPYPVMSNNDDVQGNISFGISSYCEDDDYVFLCEGIDFSNKYFEKLYKSGKIDFVFKVACSSTMFSNVFEGFRDFRISLYQLKNSFKIESFLVATKDIEDYYDDSFHEDYSANHFFIKKNSIVGYLGKHTVDLDSVYQEGASGIFTLEKSDEGILFFSVTSKNIVIHYPYEQNEPYNKMNFLAQNPSTRFTFISSVIIPALAFAVKLIQEKYRIEQGADTEFSDFIERNIWAKKIYEDYVDDFSAEYGEDNYKLTQVIWKSIFDKDQNRPIPLIGSIDELYKLINKAT